jgi:hypothetical protein
VIYEKNNLALQAILAKRSQNNQCFQCRRGFPSEWTRAITGSSKSLARNEASRMETASEQSPEYRGTPHGRFFRAGLAVELGFGGSVHEKRMNMVEHMPRSAIFLDRDGVINVDRGDIHRPDQFVPGIFHLAHFWASELQRLIVVGILEFRRFNA